MNIVTQYVVMAGLLGAIVWDVLTWLWGLPTSSSHALIGGYAGAAIARAALLHGWRAAPSVIIASGWTKTLIFIVLAPLLGLVLGFGFMVAISWIFQRKSPQQVDQPVPQAAAVLCRRLQPGTRRQRRAEDHGHRSRRALHRGRAQQARLREPTGDIGTGPLFWRRRRAIALGTYFGGWRIVHTMGAKITKLKPVGGFCAETAGAITLLGTALAGIPVSTTHTITGAIIGVGTTTRLSAVRWGVATANRVGLGSYHPRRSR